MRDISQLIEQIEQTRDHAALVNLVHAAMQEAYRAGLEKATEIALRTSARLSDPIDMDDHDLTDMNRYDPTAH